MTKTPKLDTPFGAVQLERLPRDPTHTLRAWDAADEYLLQHIHQQHTHCQQPLILNDNFGALALSLQAQHPILVNDSLVSQQAIKNNLKANHHASLQLLDSASLLPQAPLAIVKLPKNTRFFEYQLQQLNHYLPAGTPVLIGAMVKYLSNSFFKLAEQHLHGFHTTLALKKARLLLGTTRGHYPQPELAQPRQQAEVGLTLFDTPNVFSAGKLDQGSRFFVQHFPNLGNAETAIDLGCGNGILGLHALQQNPQLHVCFVDESCHALQATKRAIAGIDKSSQAQLLQNHCLQNIADKSVDAILCNPPFHQQQAVGTQIAQQMFHDSARVLKPHSSLYIIGNRHLGYHIALKKHFKTVRTLASGKKFVLWQAQSP